MMQNTSPFATLGKIIDRPVIESDWDGKVRFINDPAKHLFGLFNKDAQFEIVTDYLPQAENLLKRIENRKPSIEAGLITVVERSRLPGTTYLKENITLEVSILGNTNESGSRLFWVMRALHTEKMQSRHQLISRLLNQAKIPLSVIDEDGYYIDVNQSYCELFQYSRHELIGQPFTLIVPLEMRTKAMHQLIHFFEKGEEIHSETHFQTKTGQMITVLATANILKNPDGRKMQLLTCQDITSHIQAEQQFQKREALFHHLFDFAEVGIGLIDAEGTLQRSNLALANAFGLRPQEVVGLYFSQLFPQDHHSYAQRQFKDALLKGNVEEDEWIIKTADRIQHSIRTTFRRLTFPDGNDYILLTAFDVTTERRTRNALLKEREDTELALLDKNQFLASLARRVKTIVNPIVGFVDLLETTNLSEEQKEYLNTIQSNSHTLLGFVDDITEYTKLETEKISHRSSTINLPTLLQTLQSEFKNHKTGKAFNIQTHLASACPHNIMSDPIRLRELVRLLTLFVTKHSTKPDIRISIEGEIEKRFQTSIALRITLSTTGIHYTEKQIKRIFTPFAHLSKEASDHDTDSVLILAKCKSIAESLQAELNCFEQDGDGVCFEIQITPQIHKQEPDPATQLKQAPSEHTEHRPYHILSADDNASSRSVLKAMMSNLGHQIALTSSGLDLINTLKAEDFDLIFLDINMPGLNGYETAQKIRAGECGEKNKDIYIIAITAHSSAEVNQQCLDAGMNDFLNKPLSRKKLAKALTLADSFVF